MKKNTLQFYCIYLLYLVIGVSSSTGIIGIPSDELEVLKVQIGTEVCIYTEFEGQESRERGVVKFLGKFCRFLITLVQ